MKMRGFYFCIFSSVILSGCASTSTPLLLEKKNKKNIEYNAILTDPVIKKDFRVLKSIAMTAPIYDNETTPHFNEATIQKLNEATAILMDRLQNHYHLTSNKYKINTYVGSNKPESCYVYYHSNNTDLLGKNCKGFSHSYASCSPCNNYVSIVKSRNMKIVHAHWLHNNETTALIDTFKLRNGDFVFLGLDLSPDDD